MIHGETGWRADRRPGRQAAIPEASDPLTGDRVDVVGTHRHAVEGASPCGQYPDQLVAGVGDDHIALMVDPQPGHERTVGMARVVGETEGGLQRGNTVAARGPTAGDQE